MRRCTLPLQLASTCWSELVIELSADHILGNAGIEDGVDQWRALVVNRGRGHCSEVQVQVFDLCAPRTAEMRLDAGAGAPADLRVKRVERDDGRVTAGIEAGACAGGQELGESRPAADVEEDIGDDGRAEAPAQRCKPFHLEALVEARDRRSERIAGSGTSERR